MVFSIGMGLVPVQPALALGVFTVITSDKCFPAAAFICAQGIKSWANPWFWPTIIADANGKHQPWGKWELNQQLLLSLGVDLYIVIYLFGYASTTVQLWPDKNMKEPSAGKDIYCKFL